MIKRITAAALLLCCAAGVQAQQAPRSPLVDHPTCTRDELKAATSAYVEGQRKGDISALSFVDNAQFLENMVMIRKADGLWNTALPIAQARSFHDDVRCKTFSEIIVTKGGHPYVIGTRLYMDKGKLLRIDSLVTDKGDWLFNANAYLKYSSQETWAPLGKYQKTDPAEMIRGANAYLDFFSDKFTSVPWGTPCARLEGGAYTNRDNKPDASCEVGIPAGVLYIVNRDYMIDTEMGVINVFCRFGNSTSGMPDSHTFHYIDGRVRNVHTLSVNMNPNAPSSQADDNGGMIR